MPAANGSPLIAVSYENVASKNFDFWMRFAWNARRFGYSAFILCAKGLTATDEQMMDKFCDENNASVQVFVTFKYEKEEQRKVMAGFGDIPDIWISAIRHPASQCKSYSRNSSADPKLRATSPVDSIRSRSEACIDSSSSMMAISLDVWPLAWSVAPTLLDYRSRKDV